MRCAPCFGTVRNEPPQFPALPGTEVTSHLPASSGPPASSIWVSIHAGQVMAANRLCLIATVHGWVKVVTAAVSFSSAIPPASSKALRTVGFVSAMNRSSLAK